MANIGLYAGTFDPVHDGHISFALAALAHCGLDTVVFLPEPKPRGKHNVTDVVKRVEMLQLAIAPYKGLRVRTLPDEQFTVKQTLPQLLQLYGAELTLLMGSDVAQHVQQWPDAGELLATVRIAIGQRHGDTTPALPGAVIVPTQHAHIAASRIRSGESQAIAPQVGEYIRTNNLYVV